MLDPLLRQGLLLLQPVGFTWACLLILAGCALRLRRWRTGVVSLLLAGLLYACGSTDLPGALLRSLERPYAGVDTAAIEPGDAVVLLGGGAEPSRYEMGNLHLTRAGDRLLQAVEMMRLGKAPALVIGGGGGTFEDHGERESELVRRWILRWQLVPAGTEMLSLGACRDTHHEAVKVRDLARQRGWQRILLVTSASHLRRAVATFEAQGLTVTPVPCNFLTTLSTTPSRGGFTVPRAENFGSLSVWLHEQLGWLEYRRRGWILPVAKPGMTSQSVHHPPTPVVGTFSIVALDRATGELGVAVQSRVPAVGAIVPWARAGVGAVATQAFANPQYGPRGLALLAQGRTPEEVVRELTLPDSERAVRQLGVVSADGDSATWTGGECHAWAGGRRGPGYAIQGNILASEKVVEAMESSFLKSSGELGERLLAALHAGQEAGGDRRGMQSAALLIVREGWGYAGLDDRYRDLRVDDHPEPITELTRIYAVHRKLFPKPGTPVDP